MLRRFAASSALALLFALAPAQAEEPAPAVNAPADAARGENDLAWVVVKEPAGDVQPTSEDFVTIDYTGWNAAGEVFDSSAKHPDVNTFPLAKLSPGLQQGVRGMKVGEKRRMWIPAKLAPKGSPVVMDVELKAISRPFSTPADVAAPPADAEVTKSGLASRLISPGTGTEHPKRNSWVMVHYTGWTTDGQMFDSSYAAGQPASFKLDQVIPGWTEGVQLMVAGEKRRLWIPQKLAYRGQKGMPAGMLVFDVELVRFR